MIFEYSFAAFILEDQNTTADSVLQRWGGIFNLNVIFSVVLEGKKKRAHK